MFTCLATTGPDSFAYSASNQGTPSATKTVTLTVTLAAPSCRDLGGLRTAEDQDLAVTLQCTSASGRAITYAVDSPVHGTIVDFNPGTGDVTYRPPAGFSGDDSFTYTATDSGETSAPATVSITVDPRPSCDDVSRTTAFATPTTVALPCADATGRPLTWVLRSEPSHGTLAGFNPDTGDVTYTPADGYSGTDSFTFGANSANGESATATVQLIVLPQRPVCQNVTGQTTRRRTALPIALQCSTNPGASLTYAIVGGPEHGTLSGLDATSGRLTYTPDRFFTGNDTFTYTATNAGGTADTATVSIVVKRRKHKACVGKVKHKRAHARCKKLRGRR